MPPAPPTLPYTRFGPGPVNPIATAALIYNQTYNAGRPPPVDTSTAPTITIGLTWSSTGSNTLETGLPSLLAFIVDIINGRGGVWMDGVQYSLSILLGDDQSSVAYMQLLYEDMLAEGVQLFLAPFGDDFTTPLLPLIHTSNATFYNVEPSNPAVFANNTGGNLWAFAPTADLYLRTSLDLINTATQTLHNQTQSRHTTASGYISPYGLTTVCAYTANVTLFEVQHSGLLDWVNDANSARTAAGAHEQDIVRLLVDETVPNYGADGSVYKPYFAACPDNVDVLILLIDGMGAVEGIAASQLSAKAVVGLTGNDGFNSNVPAQVEAAAGLLQPIPVDVPLVGDIPASRFTNAYELIELLEIYTAIAYGSPTTPTTALLGYGANIAEVVSAVNLSASLALTDMRAGTLALNGFHSMSGLITFNASTGVNVARIGQVSQMLPSGLSQIVSSQADLIFPYPWPWHRISAGDAVHHSQASSWIILGLVITVLGTWVAQIIVEQAIFSRRRRGMYHVWLAIVTLSLGGVGVWCSLLVQSTALTTTLPGESSAQPIAWSLGALFIAVVPCLLLTFFGLWTVIGDVERSQEGGKRAERAARVGQALRAEKAARKKAAALSNRQHLTYLIDCITWRAALGGLLMAAAVVLTRVALWPIWVQTADYESVAWAWVVTLLIDIVLIPTALLMFIHALRWRIIAVFIFSGAVMADWQIMIASMHFTYAPTRTAFLDSATISLDGIVVLAGLIAAAIAFIFIGLLFSAMRLSRNDLSVLVVELEAAVARLKGKAADDAARMQQRGQQIDVLARSLEAVNVLSSLPQDYALSLAVYSSVQQLSGRDRGSSGSAMGSAVLSSRAESQVQSRADEQSVSDSADGQQAAVGLPSTPQQSELVARSSRKSLAVAPLTVISPRLDASVVDTQDRPPSQSRISPVGMLTQAERELESKLEATLAALAHFRVDVSSSSSGVIDGSNTVTGPMFSGRPRITGSSSSLSAPAPAVRGTVNDFQLTAPLLGKAVSTIDDSTAAPTLPQPTMDAIIEHPVAVEVFKEELRKSQSVESLVFCLHVRRYRSMQSKKVRRLLAGFIADAFVRANSPQQINIHSRQRDSILAIVDKTDAVCPVTLFDEAERECRLLIRTNVFKGFTATNGYRLCAWLCHSLDVRAVLRPVVGETNSAQSEAAGTELSWITGQERGSQSNSVTLT